MNALNPREFTELIGSYVHLKEKDPHSRAADMFLITMQLEKSHDARKREYAIGLRKRAKNLFQKTLQNT